MKSDAPGDMAELDAVATVDLVRRGQVSALEVTEAAITRIEALDPQLNAVIHRRYDQARREAAVVDGGQPLAGVPLLLKDVDLAGDPHFNGSRVYARLDQRLTSTDLFAARLQAAGAILLGRTNIPEFTSRPVTESVLHGACRNPWDLDRTPGGSSGGAAAAVAAGMVPAAQSSDGGGSSRIPAAATGLFTLKTSRGRTPLAPSGADWMDITASKSFLTRTVRDFATLLDVVAGQDRIETIGAPAAIRPFAQEVGADPGRLRIGFTTIGPGASAPLDGEAVKAVEDAAALLAQLGHQVEEVAPDTYTSEESLDILRGYWPIKVAMRAAPAERALGRPLGEDDLEPLTLAMLNRARRTTMAETGALLLQIRDFTLRSLAWWEDYDLLLTATTGQAAPRIGETDGRGEAAQLATYRWSVLTPFANITGQPAASIPLHWTAEGLPLGVQLIADAWRDDLLLRVASQLEAARPWAVRLAAMR